MTTLRLDAMDSAGLHALRRHGSPPSAQGGVSGATPLQECQTFISLGKLGELSRSAAEAALIAVSVMRVLIVEDEIFAALHLEAAIEDLGCEVVGIAPDARSALELAETGPDLALVDLNLRDGLTGPEIARHLANRYGTKVLILTANPRQAGDAFEGLIGVVSKPWSEVQLARTMADIRRAH